MKLRELQLEFLAAIQDPQNISEICAQVQSTKELPAAERIGIYRDSIMGCLQKALSGIFPVCQKLVGEIFFNAMADFYIKKTPSHSPNLDDYGQSFPEFLAGFLPAKNLLYLPDVARLELAWQKAFGAADAPSIDLEELSQAYLTSPERLVFQLPPGSTLLSSPYPILKIWEVNQDHYHGDPTIQLEPGSTHYFLIWRKELEMRIESLPKEEWEILGWMSQGMLFGPLCEQAVHKNPQTKIAEYMLEFVQRGWVTSFTIA